MWSCKIRKNKLSAFLFLFNGLFFPSLRLLFAPSDYKSFETIVRLVAKSRLLSSNSTGPEISFRSMRQAKRVIYTDDCLFPCVLGSRRSCPRLLKAATNLSEFSFSRRWWKARYTWFWQRTMMLVKSRWFNRWDYFFFVFFFIFNYSLCDIVGIAIDRKWTPSRCNEKMKFPLVVDL